ncbi:winged helix DNA-binding domain-containing protein [uncultured Corynebacterium sp.]|uniref:winged helix DNA-binding domain-containing protein n=1 Tax=uncultured Corynebacterium sp. TaxID=159447 RepID=UPI0025924DD2|nr:winged helix DNA-binding domain-containing protein [uncultured Corynebacterium sp.]
MSKNPDSAENTTTISLRELRARRLIAQLLAPSAAHPLASTLQSLEPLSAISTVAEWMIATQFQLRNSGLEALAIRAGASTQQVEEAITQGLIVRSWSQRGTHHALFAPDVSWVTRVCSPRVQAASTKRRPMLGLTDEDVDSSRTALIKALSASDSPLSRTDCYEVFRSAGVDPGEQRGPHMLRHFGGEGEIIQGPFSGNADSFVLHDSVVSQARDVDKKKGREAAIVELAARYIDSRGPATPQDFSWWAGLTVKECKDAFAAVTSQGKSTQVTCNNITYHMGNWQQEVTHAELNSALTLELRLPAFDEYLLAYKDRSQVIEPHLTPEVGPSKNGMCWPFLVENGEVLGRAPQSAG